MREITPQPGGVVSLHNHVDRPAITFLLEGQMMYRPDGEPDMVANPGSCEYARDAMKHWDC